MSHNGGLSQINVTRLLDGGEYLYCNHFKRCQIWSCNDGATSFDMSKHDADGYMHTVYGTGFVGVGTRVDLPAQSARPGQYVLKWSGTGTIGASGLSSQTATNGRYVFTPSTTNCSIIITGVGTPGSDYPHDIIFCHVDDEALVDADPYAFSPYLKTKYAKVGVIRWHDPQRTNNGCNVITWAHRMPITHYSYEATRFISSIYAGVTTNSGDNYSATLPGFTLVDKAIVHAKINVTSSGYTPTLNIQSTGAKAIRDRTCSVNIYDVRKPTAGRTGTFVYDLELDYWIQHGADDFTELGNFGVSGGIPIEHIVKFCNEIGCHLSFSFPHYAVDPISDYVQSVIDYVKLNLNSGLKVKYTISNEVWNLSVYYTQTHYAMAREKAKYPAGASDDYANWYGRALAKVGKLVHTAYAGDTSRYDVICECQAYGNTTASANRMESAHYVTETSAANAAKNYVTKGSAANYWHSSFSQTATEATMATEYASATAARKLELINQYVTDESGSNIFTLTAAKAKCLYWATWFATYSCGFEPYEGGYDAGWDEGSGNLQAFTRACYGAPALRPKTLELYRYIASIGGSFPSQYTAVGGNNFAVIHNDVYGELSISPAWDGILDYSSPKGMAVGLQFRM